jgi:hypothetical protein
MMPEPSPTPMPPISAPIPEPSAPTAAILVGSALRASLKISKVCLVAFYKKYAPQKKQHQVDVIKSYYSPAQLFGKLQSKYGTKWEHFYRSTTWCRQSMIYSSSARKKGTKALAKELGDIAISHWVEVSFRTFHDPNILILCTPRTKCTTIVVLQGSSTKR